MTVATTASEQRPRDGSRARLPDEDGYVERDGVRVFLESFGAGEQTVLFLPTWTLVHSRIWKAQIAYFARHFRVICFDPRGNGRSDRPREPSAYDEREFAQDALDVMDACGVDRAVVVTLSSGAQRGMLLAAEHPERVAGMVFIGPFAMVGRFGTLRMRARSMAVAMKGPLTTRGWGKYHPGYWARWS